MKTLNKAAARAVLKVVDAGLVSGLGKPKPGHMCVEAAICYALGLPHGDQPQCVAVFIRKYKIRINDAAWSSNAALNARDVGRDAYAAYAAYAAAADRDNVLNTAAEICVEACIKFKTPGSKWLDITEEKAA